MSGHTTKSRTKRGSARSLFAVHGTQPEEGSSSFVKLLDAWNRDLQPQTHQEEFLCRELAAVEWRLERLRRIENGILWWAIDDIRDRNHEAARHGQPTGKEEMSEDDHFTLTMARGFKFACAQHDTPMRIARIEAGLVRRMYKALETVQKLRAPTKAGKKE